ncbi:MAG TPA: hypothetical protein VG389_22155 [Myxococcota bacterium]|jgi:hypothetical protein|nr:hypothetical protein [Myxococcota bacterium]
MAATSDPASRRPRAAAPALVLAAALLSACAQPSAPPRTLPSTMSSPPEFPPAMLEACAGDGTVRSLAELMSRRFNPALTRISYTLHHDARDTATRMEDVVGTTAVLLGCVHETPVHFAAFRGMDLRRSGDFYHFLEALQTDVLALQLAATELDDEAARHWFEHAKQDCAACHARFRGAEAASAPPLSPLGPVTASPP